MERRFYCLTWDCELSKASCAARYVRGQALRQVFDRREIPRWVPQGWAGHLACRGCPVGALHAQETGTRRPARGPKGPGGARPVVAPDEPEGGPDDGAG